MLNRTLSRSIAAALSAIILFQTVAADAAEALWAGRRSALPAATAAMPALPPVTPVAPRAVLPPSDSRRPVDRLAAALPPANGRIAVAGSIAATAAVVLIEDVHRNDEAQANIAKGLGALLDAGLAPVVALEGAAGPIALEPYRAFPFPRATRAAADFFLREHLISGAIHAALTLGRVAPVFSGAEDEGIYQANIAAVRLAAKARDAADDRLTRDAAAIERRAASVLPPALRALASTVGGYHRGTVSLGDYLTALAAVRAPSPAVRNFLEALRLESSLSFPQVEAERRAILGRLAERLSRTDLEAFAADAVAFRTGRLRAAEFYGRFATLAERRGVPAAAYPQLNAYLRYVALADGVDAARLLADAEALEAAALSGLAVTPEERAVLADARRNELAKKLVALSLTAAEWSSYRRDADPSADLAPFMDFYRTAERRDDVMVERLLGAMRRQGATEGVLVAGGFHTAGVRDRLLAQGVACVQYSPRVTKAGDGAAYLSAFTREKTPLERLFDGQRIFLAEPPIAPALARQLPAAQAAIAYFLDPSARDSLTAWYARVRHGNGAVRALTATADGVSIATSERVDGRDVRLTTAYTLSRDGALRAERTTAGTDVLASVALLAPAVEGATLVHFLPFFPLLHARRSPEQWFGMGLIYAGAVAFAYAGGSLLHPELTTLLWAIAGGVSGHTLYNALAVRFGWAPLSLILFGGSNEKDIESTFDLLPQLEDAMARPLLNGLRPFMNDHTDRIATAAANMLRRHPTPRLLGYVLELFDDAELGTSNAGLIAVVTEALDWPMVHSSHQRLLQLVGFFNRSLLEGGRISREPFVRLLAEMDNDDFRSRAGDVLALGRDGFSLESRAEEIRSGVAEIIAFLDRDRLDALRNRPDLPVFIRESTVGVLTHDGRGSGFYVTEDADNLYFLTAAHVASDRVKVQVLTKDGTKDLKATVLVSWNDTDEFEGPDDLNDIAVVAVRRKDAKGVSMTPVRFAQGNASDSHGLPGVVASGLYRVVREPRSALPKENGRILEFTQTARADHASLPGDSGSAVVTPLGDQLRVIGLHVTGMSWISLLSENRRRIVSAWRTATARDEATTFTRFVTYEPERLAAALPALEAAMLEDDAPGGRLPQIQRNRPLSHDLSRRLARAAGLDPDGFASVALLAPAVEGATLVHFLPFFPLLHGARYHASQWIGMALIYGAAIGLGVHFDSFLWAYVGGILGHVAYNALTFATGWSPLVLFNQAALPIPTVPLSDAELETYFGAAAAARAKAEGRTFYFRGLDPATDNRFLDQWRNGIDADADWRAKWEARNGDFSNGIPRTGSISPWTVGLVSAKDGEERLEGLLSGGATGASANAGRKGAKLGMEVAFEVYYRNIGQDRDVPGVIDALWDFAIKFIAEDGRFTGGLVFDAVTPGSEGFARRRGIPNLGRSNFGLNNTLLRREYDRRGLADRFKAEERHLMPLAMGWSGAVGEWLGFERDGFETKAFVAPILEGATLLHFLPVFPLLHGGRYHASQWIGMAFIYAAAIGLGFHFDSTLWVWLGGIVGHAAYNALSVVTGWSPLALGDNPEDVIDAAALSAVSLYNGRQSAKSSVSYVDILAVALQGRPRVRSVDLGTGAGRFLPQIDVRLHAALPDAEIIQYGTDTGILNYPPISPFPDNAAFLEMRGPASMDFVSINAPFPNQRVDMASMADRLVKDDGLLAITAGFAGVIRGLVPWLLVHGYTVALVSDITDHPGYSDYEGDADTGTIFASRTNGPVFDLFRARGIQVVTLAPSDRVAGYLSRLGTFGVDAGETTLSAIAATTRVTNDAAEEGLAALARQGQLIRSFDVATGVTTWRSPVNARRIQIRKSPDTGFAWRAAIPPFVIPTHPLTWDELRPYFGAEAIRRYRAEGRTFVFRRLDRDKDLPLIRAWEKIAEADEAWQQRWEAIIIPMFKYIDETSFGLVSTARGESRLEAIIGGQLVPHEFSIPARQFSASYAITQFEIFYRNIGRAGETPGMADLIWDYAVKTLFESGLFTGGLEMNAVSPGSAAFAKRHGLTRGSGTANVGLTADRLGVEYDRRGLPGKFLPAKPLTLSWTRALAAKAGLDPNGAWTELLVAPIVEGGLLLHFLPFFPWLHKDRSWATYAGTIAIAGAAIGAAFLFGTGLHFETASVLSAWIAGIAAHAAVNAIARLTRPADVPLNAFMDAVGLLPWAFLSRRETRTLKRTETPDGPLFVRRVALSTLPGFSREIFARQFGDRTFNTLGPVEEIDFLHDVDGRLVAIVPVPNAAMLRMARLSAAAGVLNDDRNVYLDPSPINEVAARDLYRRLEAPEDFWPSFWSGLLVDGKGTVRAVDFYSALRTLPAVENVRNDRVRLELRPILLSDANFIPPQPGAASPDAIRRAWTLHETAAYEDAKRVDAYIGRSPLHAQFRRPLVQPEERQADETGPAPRRGTNAFTFINVHPREDGSLTARIATVSAIDFIADQPYAPTVKELTAPANPGEVKAIIPVLPTVYNAGRSSISMADEGYHRQLLRLGDVYRYMMRRNLTAGDNRLFVNGVGAGSDMITSYVGWMKATGQVPFAPGARGPHFDVWDVNPFAVANAVVVGRMLGIDVSVARPDDKSFHDIFVQNRPSFNLGLREDARQIPQALEKFHDNVTSDSFLRDVRFYREKFRGGRTLAILWDAEYWEGENDVRNAVKRGDLYLPRDAARQQVPVVQTTLERGGTAVARWSNRQEMLNQPAVMKVVPLHQQLKLTKQTVYATFAVKSLETRPDAPNSLTLGLTRAAGAALGASRDGAVTEVVVAPLVEGGLLLHFLPFFPLLHEERSWHQWIGQAMIYAFALGFGFGFDSYAAAWLGGIAAHALYNGLRRLIPATPERILARALVRAATDPDDLEALMGDVVRFDVAAERENGGVSARAGLPILDESLLKAEIARELRISGVRVSDADARRATRRFWTAALGSTAAARLPDANLLFPDLASLERALPNAPRDRNAVLYALGTDRDRARADALSREQGRRIELIEAGATRLADGRLDLGALDDLLSRRFSAAELESLFLVLDGADIDSLIGAIAALPSTSAFRRLRYVALDVLLQTAVPLGAADLLQMNVMAAALAARQA